MDTIHITNGEKTASIDPQGAWVTTVSDSGWDILFPRESLQTADGAMKQRGGCHVCLPNFGPGGESDLAQHGFGRELLWSIDEKHDDLVRLSLRNDHPEYHDMVAYLSYQVTDVAFRMELEVYNNGLVPLKVAPAFHPYFALYGDTEPQLNGTALSLAQLGEADYVNGERQVLTVADNSIEITSTGLPEWAVWTDLLGSYVCIEPTQSGMSFLPGEHDRRDMLLPHKPRQYVCEIHF